MHRLPAAVIAVILGVASAGCSSSDDQPQPEAQTGQTPDSALTSTSASAGSSSPSTPTASSPTPTEAGNGMPVAPQPENTLEQTNAANDEACAEDERQTVKMLDPVVVPKVRVEATTFETVEEGGERIEEVVVPGFVVPGYTINAGCIVYHEAPPGCAGGVTITGYEIPGVRIPDATVPERTLPDGSVQPAKKVSGGESQGVVVPPESVGPVCQVVKREVKFAATRPPVSRRPASRKPISRDSASQPSQSVTVEGSDESFYAPSRYLPSAYVPSVYVPSSYAPSEYLPYVALEGEPEVDVAKGDDTRAYVAPSKVLFDEDKSILKPAARTALQAIVNDIDRSSPQGRITVDGYTDNQGSAAYGLTLSKARADAVADWLTSTGGLPESQIAAIRGYGERNPAAPNTTEASMAKNRRVVISVAQ